MVIQATRAIDDQRECVTERLTYKIERLVVIVLVWSYQPDANASVPLRSLNRIWSLRWFNLISRKALASGCVLNRRLTPSG